MRQFGIVTDAGCSLPPETCTDMGILRIPFLIRADGRDYSDNDEMNPEVLDAALSSARTSSVHCPSPEVYLEAYREMDGKGFHDLLVLTINSSFSDSYYCAVLAARLYTRDGTNGKTVKVVDSKSIGAGQDLLLFSLGKMRDENYSCEQAEAGIREKMEKLRTLCLPGDMERIFRTGRIPVLGQTLLRKFNIYSVLEGKPDGRILSAGKRVGWKRGAALFRKICTQAAPGKKLVLVEQGAERPAAELMDGLQGTAGERIELHARGLMGYFLNRGGLMAAYLD